MTAPQPTVRVNRYEVTAPRADDPSLLIGVVINRVPGGWAIRKGSDYFDRTGAVTDRTAAHVFADLDEALAVATRVTAQLAAGQPTGRHLRSVA